VEDIDGSVGIPSEAEECWRSRVPLLALEIINSQPRFVSNKHVFAGRGDGHFSGFSEGKKTFDAKLPPMPRWVIHDLRRTARSLMSRAGVRPDIAERVMGHAIQGVEGVYDRHSYRKEKAHALKARQPDQNIWPQEGRFWTSRILPCEYLGQPMVTSLLEGGWHGPTPPVPL
jgi:hypothetical protein